MKVSLLDLAPKVELSRRENRANYPTYSFRSARTVVRRTTYAHILLKNREYA